MVPAGPANSFIHACLGLLPSCAISLPPQSSVICGFAFFFFVVLVEDCVINLISRTISKRQTLQTPGVPVVAANHSREEASRGRNQQGWGWGTGEVLAWPVAARLRGKNHVRHAERWVSCISSCLCSFFFVMSKSVILRTIKSWNMDQS